MSDLVAELREARQELLSVYRYDSGIAGGCIGLLSKAADALEAAEARAAEFEAKWIIACGDLNTLRHQNPDKAEHDPEAHYVQDPDNFVLSEGCPACLAIAAQNRTSAK